MWDVVYLSECNIKQCIVGQCRIDGRDPGVHWFSLLSLQYIALPLKHFVHRFQVLFIKTDIRA